MIHCYNDYFPHNILDIVEGGNYFDLVIFHNNHKQIYWTIESMSTINHHTMTSRDSNDHTMSNNRGGFSNNDHTVSNNSGRFLNNDYNMPNNTGSFLNNNYLN